MDENEKKKREEKRRRDESLRKYREFVDRGLRLPKR